MADNDSPEVMWALTGIMILKTHLEKKLQCVKSKLTEIINTLMYLVGKLN